MVPNRSIFFIFDTVGDLEDVDWHEEDIVTEYNINGDMPFDMPFARLCFSYMIDF